MVKSTLYLIIHKFSLKVSLKMDMKVPSHKGVRPRKLFQTNENNSLQKLNLTSVMLMKNEIERNENAVTFHSGSILGPFPLLKHFEKKPKCFSSRHFDKKCFSKCFTRESGP